VYSIYLRSGLTVQRATHPAKYSHRVNDLLVYRILGNSNPTSTLVSACYADNTWKKLGSALNSLQLFANQSNLYLTWPVSSDTVNTYIEWAVITKKLSPGTVSTYIANIALIHKLRNLDSSACTNFIGQKMLRGAENLQFYSSVPKNTRKTMTLPLLKILGHELASLNWSVRSKSVVWCAMCTCFFGSFRFGELLAKTRTSFNCFETFLWRDIKYLSDGSLQIKNKIPKNRQANGEVISLFPFPGHGCCPIKAMNKLQQLSSPSENGLSPVFQFDNGSFLTCELMNKLLSFLLKKHLGEEAKFYTCHSFRPALPSALAAHPQLGNDIAVKRWGRWNSETFERYIRLSHIAKKELFVHFSVALNCPSYLAKICS